MKAAFFFAWRFILNPSDKTIRTMMLMCFISIMVGAFALALVAAVMNGFEKETQKVVQGIQPDLIIQANNQALNYSKIKEVLESYPFVAASSPNSQGHALIKVPGNDDLSSLVMVTAIDPATQQDVSRLHTLIKQPGASQLKDVLLDNKILIGQALAEQLGVSKGDRITLLYTNDTTADADIMLEQKDVVIGGIFKTGIQEVDGHLIFTDFGLFNSLFPEKGVTLVGVKLSPGSSEKNALAILKDRFKSFSLYSWKDLYPALLSALTLEKYAMFLILALITIVASMNIVALLFMYITAKKSEIAVLKTMGLSSKELVRIFVMIGMGISLIAGFIGLIGAIGVSYLLEHYSLIPLPEAYYVSHLPAHMDYTIILSVIILVTVVSFLASYIPARRIYSLDPAPVLKQTV